MHELTTSLFEDMKGTSAPGIDGFTVNFIRKFWPPLSHVVKNAINTSKSKGELTITMRFAIFKLLRKGEKDPTLAANFRPISLLSVVYKLVSCVIKNRLKKVLPQIIGKQQKAYVDSDNIGAVLLNLLSSMKSYNEKKKWQVWSYVSIFVKPLTQLVTPISKMYLKSLILGMISVTGLNFFLQKEKEKSSWMVT